MSARKRSSTTRTSASVARLVAQGARYGVDVDAVSARSIARLGPTAAIRKVDDSCRLIRVARHEDIELSFGRAVWRLGACGGDIEEAIRRMLAGGLEFRAGITETVQYADDRGISLAPHSVYDLFKKRGQDGARRYVDQLAGIMDAAAMLGIDCPQTLATRRLSLADGDAQRVVADFAAAQRRRADRLTATCRAPIPPRALEERSNALAGCGCPRCSDRLAAQMVPYIGKMIAAPFFARLDRDEARALANVELLEAVDTWPGGNFTGWFAQGFRHRVLHMYARQTQAERNMLSLDAPGVLSYDDDGRSVPLGERIPDRSVDVLNIVLLRERVAEMALEQRQARADRGEKYEPGSSPQKPEEPLRLAPQQQGHDAGELGHEAA